MDDCHTDLAPQCDETRPKCSKCVTYGMSCNYDSNAPDLQMSCTGIVTFNSRKSCNGPADHSLVRKADIRPGLCLPIISSDCFSTFELDSRSIDRLGRFQTRTALSIGSPTLARMYQRVTLELAISVGSGPCTPIPQSS